MKQSLESVIKELSAGGVTPKKLAELLRGLQGSSWVQPPRVAYNIGCYAARRASDEATDGYVTYLRLGLERGPEPWVWRDPSFDPVRSTDGRRFRQVVRGGNSHAELARLDALGRNGAERLWYIEIRTPLELLGQAGPVQTRKALAKSVGVSTATAMAWAHLAELALIVERGCFAPALPPKQPPSASRQDVDEPRQQLPTGGTAVAAKDVDPTDQPPAKPTELCMGAPPCFEDPLDIVNLLSLAGVGTKAELAKWHRDESAQRLAQVLKAVNKRECILKAEPTMECIAGLAKAAKAEVERDVARVDAEPPPKPASAGAQPSASTGADGTNDENGKKDGNGKKDNEDQ